MEIPLFSHVWKGVYRWQPTKATYYDFKYVEYLGTSSEGRIYLAWTATERFILLDSRNISTSLIKS